MGLAARAIFAPTTAAASESANVDPHTQRFEAYLERFRQPIYSYVLRLVHEVHLAEDICQEVFIRLYRELDNIRDATASAWLYQVARNLVTDMSRKKRPVLFTVLRGKHQGGDGDDDGGVEFEDDDLRPEESLMGLETRALVREGLSRMSAKYREPLLLCDMENLTYEEAAKVLEVSVKTVSERLHRGRDFLANFLARHLHGEDGQA